MYFNSGTVKHIFCQSSSAFETVLICQINCKQSMLFLHHCICCSLHAYCFTKQQCNHICVCYLCCLSPSVVWRLLRRSVVSRNVFGYVMDCHHQRHTRHQDWTELPHHYTHTHTDVHSVSIGIHTQMHRGSVKNKKVSN